MAKGRRKPRAARVRAADDIGNTVKWTDAAAGAPPPAAPLPTVGEEPTAPLAADAARLSVEASEAAARQAVASPPYGAGDSNKAQPALSGIEETATPAGESAGAADVFEAAEATPAPEVSRPHVQVTDGRDDAVAVPAVPRALATRYVETLMSVAHVNVKAMGALQASSSSTLQLMERLMGARSLREAMRLQTEHARKQFQVLSQQAKEFAALARRMVEDTSPPESRRIGDGE